MNQQNDEAQSGARLRFSEWILRHFFTVRFGKTGCESGHG